MQAVITCKTCQHTWQAHHEPRALAAITCPQCDTQAHVRASEDLSSAVEDALAQLWHVSEHFELDLSLSTRSIPPAFKPPS